MRLFFFAGLLFFALQTLGKGSALPDDNVSHFPQGYRVAEGVTGVEWDSRLIWLEAEDGRKFGVFVMSSLFAARTGFPLYLDSKGEVAVLAITDEFGRKWELFSEGQMDDQFHFRAESEGLSWVMTRTETTADLKVSSSKIDLNLKAVATKPKTYYMNYGGDRPGWFSVDGKSYHAYVDQTNLKVNGWMRLGDEKFKVTGSSWMERNWAEVDILSAGANPFAWDFFFLQLDMNGAENDVIAFQMKDPWNGKPWMKYAAVTLESGELVILNPKDVGIKTLSQARQNGRKYATSWSLDLSAFKGLKVDLSLIPPDPWVGSSASGFEWGHFDGPCRMRASFLSSEGVMANAPGNAWAEQVNTTWVRSQLVPWLDGDFLSIFQLGGRFFH